MNLDEFFDLVEADQHAHQENLKDYALELLETSTMREDDDGLKEELITTTPTPERWREIFERLNLNQLRAIDLPNWSQTAFNKSFKKHGISNSGRNTPNLKAAGISKRFS
jgi:hypothetical protein